MDPFSYLSVLLSIIIGLAITQLLQGFGRIIQARKRVKMFWPAIVLAALFVLIAVQMWWALFDLRERTTWSFFPFLVVVLQTIMFYLTTAVMLPEIGPGEAIDLQQYYFAEARWIFGFAIVTVLISLARDLVLNWKLPNPANTLILCIFIGTSLTGMFCRRVWLHKLIVVFSVLLFAVYILLLFTRLPG
jgi:hypothetical protein